MNNYFSHDSNARNSDKLIPLRAKLGAEGYGVYFMILERLREEPTYMSIKDYNMLAFDLRVDTAIIKAVVEDFGLFVFTDNGKYFYSEGFLKRMKAKDEKSEKTRESARKRWEKVRDKCERNTNVSDDECESNADAMQEKERKEKKRRVKESEGEKSISLSSSRSREEQQRERIFNFFLFEKKMRNAAAERQRFQDVYVSTMGAWSTEQLEAKLRLWEIKTQGKHISASPEFWDMWRTLYDFCVKNSVIGDYAAFAEVDSVEYEEYNRKFRIRCSSRLSRFLQGTKAVRELWENGAIKYGLTTI